MDWQLLLGVDEDRVDRVAIVIGDATFTYRELRAAVAEWLPKLPLHGVWPGQCVALRGNMSPDLVALLIALAHNRNIVVPFVTSGDAEVEQAMEIACVEHSFVFSPDGARYNAHAYGQAHALLERLRSPGPEAGLVLFTSGSTGTSKAAVHRFDRLLANVTRRPALPQTTSIFLMLDHIGGMNTLLHVLAHGGKAVFQVDHSVEAVCRTIERHGVEILPTTPTFLNMLLISSESVRYDLSSLKLITYGTEPMLPTTLRGLNERLPGVRLKQTYGMTEVGILPTCSENAGSLWMKIGSDSCETKVIDGILWIRSNSAMIGYLNWPSPFSEDGWLVTGDRVEVRDEYLRVLGRDSEMINVGGNKVFPADVENVILEMPEVDDVVVTGRRNAVTGQMIVATVRTGSGNAHDIERRVRDYCRARLPAYKVPAAVRVTESDLFGARYKKLRAKVDVSAAECQVPDVV